MNIEWWMIDGMLCLIVFIAAVIGAAKGIGDTIIRIAAVIGGGALAFFYSDRVAKYLRGTSLNTTLHDHFYEIVRGDAEAGAGGEEMSSLPDVISGKDGSIAELISKSLSGLFSSAADKAADAAADRLTEIAVNVIAFALIVLAVVLAAAVLKALLRFFRKSVPVLGFADRLLGFVLGGVRGLLLAWIAAALLIPVTTIFSPEKVPEMMAVMQQTTVAQVLYDVNPLLYVVKLLMK